MEPMLLTNIISGIFKPATELIDNLHTSTEEKLNSKTELLRVQAATLDKALDYEQKTMASKAEIVRAEAMSDSWLTANWRPIVMLGMFTLVLGDTFGFLPNPLSAEAWTLLQIGLGGYVVGRSAEKVMKTRISS